MSIEQKDIKFVGPSEALVRIITMKARCDFCFGSKPVARADKEVSTENGLRNEEDQPSDVCVDCARAIVSFFEEIGPIPGQLDEQTG